MLLCCGLSGGMRRGVSWRVVEGGDSGGSGAKGRGSQRGREEV